MCVGGVCAHVRVCMHAVCVCVWVHKHFCACVWGVCACMPCVCAHARVFLYATSMILNLSLLACVGLHWCACLIGKHGLIGSLMFVLGRFTVVHFVTQCSFSYLSELHISCVCTQSLF